MTHALITVKDHLEDLHKKAQRVNDPTAPEIRTLVDDMIRIMRAQKGIGLAAPQVADFMRVIVIDVDTTSERMNTPLICINPTITGASRELVMTEEGCLSVPDTFIPIVRNKEVRVRYFDINGKQQTLTAQGLRAIVFQHEIDHLDGILIIDRYKQQTHIRSHFSEDITDSTPNHRIE